MVSGRNRPCGFEEGDVSCETFGKGTKLHVWPERFLIVRFGLHVGLNLKICVRMRKQFLIHSGASGVMRVSIAQCLG